MKRILLLICLMLGLAGARIALAGDCKSYFDVDPENASALLADKQEAQALKAEAVELVKVGKMSEASAKYLAAAEKHPETLVQASYTWNAACALVAEKDENFDWKISAGRASNNAVVALKLLLKAETLANAPSPYCSKGVDKENLLRMIKLVRAWVSKFSDPQE